MAIHRLLIEAFIFMLLDILQLGAMAMPCTFIQGNVNVSSSTCIPASDALLYITAANIQIEFEPGVHVLSFNRSVSPIIDNITGVTFRGLTDDSSAVSLSCDNEFGLVFLQTDQLLIENVTITDCLARPEQVALAQAFVESTFTQVIPFPNYLNAAIIVAASTDVQITNVVISDIKGIGMVGLNLLGATTITNVAFISNRPSTLNCPPLDIYSTNKSDTNGGGLYLLYQDSEQADQGSAPVLTINECVFTNNTDCTDLWIPELYNEQTKELPYSFGGGGGFTLILAQMQYQVRTNVRNSDFVSNVAKFGSGAHIGFFTGTERSTVTFNRCSFIGNGFQGDFNSGGGMSVIIDLLRPNGFRGTRRVLTNPLVNIINTDFTENTATYGGAMYIFDRLSDGEEPTLFRIQRSSFRQNMAPAASAILLFNRESSIFNSPTQTEIIDSSFVRNNAEFQSDVEQTTILGTTVLTRGGVLVLSGRTRFNRNFGAALTSSSTHIYIDGEINFSNTTGYKVGAMQLSDLATLILRKNSRLTFTHNTAPVAGGAIYDGTEGSNLRYGQQGCFLYFEQVDRLPQVEQCPDFASLNVSIIFSENQAILGANLYGSTLQNCNWVPCLRNFSNYNDSLVIQLLLRHEIIRVTESSIQSPISSLQFATPPSAISFPNYTQQRVMPGEQFHVDTTVYDEFNQSISSGLGSAVGLRGSLNLISENQAFSRLGPNGFWFVEPPNGTGSELVPVTIFGEENQRLLVTVGSLDEGALTANSFNVQLTSCLLGFRYNRDKQRCICDRIFTETRAQCNDSTGTITLPDGLWMGVVSENESNPRSQRLGYTDCVLNYCRLGAINITRGNFDARCSMDLNREGIGCGACRANLSTTFGSNQCLKCTNYSLFLIIAFAFTGVGLFIAKAAFKITISEGYLNTVLFYSNILNLFALYLAPIRLFGGAFVPVSWLSLNLGIQACFYDGMTTLVAYGLRFAYVFYLFLLMIIVVIVARRFELPRSFNYSPTKVFATLLLLCYSSLLETCVSIFAFTFVNMRNGERSVRWFYDANVVYFDGLHGFLFLLSVIVMILYVIPFPFFILSPRLILRVKFFNKLKPLLDPFWAPLKPNFEWWVSFRLLFRFIPVCLTGFVSLPHSVFILGICLLCLLFLQMKLQPFDCAFGNCIDDLLVTNLVFLCFGFLYFNTGEPGDVNSEENLPPYTFFFVALAYIFFCALLVIQVDRNFPEIKKCLIDCLSKLRKGPSPENNEEQEEPQNRNDFITYSEVVVSPRHVPKGSIHFASPDAGEMLNNVEYTRYRESLLGDEDIDFERSNEFLDTIQSNRTLSTTKSREETTM